MRLKITGMFDEKRLGFRHNPMLIFLFYSFLVFWMFSWLVTDDKPNWYIENILTFASVIIFCTTYKRFIFSDLSYSLIVFFLGLHIYGSMYSYADNPLGFWLMDLLNWERNHYDRIIHFCSGFVLAYPVIELSYRALNVPRKLLLFTPFLFAISTGALYEIMEWAVADLFFPAQGTNYLGTQGDVWDAQKDMFMAMVGSIVLMPLFAWYMKNKPVESEEVLGR